MPRRNDIPLLASLLLCLGCTAGTGPAARPSTSAPDLVVVTDASFEARVLHAAGPVLVVFEAAWCPICVEMKPDLSRLAAERRGRATVARLDVDGNAFISQRYGVRRLPAFLLFRDGRVVGRLEGRRTLQELDAALSSVP